MGSIDSANSDELYASLDRNEPPNQVDHSCQSPEAILLPEDATPEKTANLAIVRMHSVDTSNSISLYMSSSQRSGERSDFSDSPDLIKESPSNCANLADVRIKDRDLSGNTDHLYDSSTTESDQVFYMFNVFFQEVTKPKINVSNFAHGSSLLMLLLI